jgi:hypothetical protein
MRQDATLMLNHSITKDAMKCEQCHAPREKGVMALEELGYPPARVKDLRDLEELKMISARKGAAAATEPRLRDRLASAAAR